MHSVALCCVCIGWQSRIKTRSIFWRTCVSRL